MKQLPDGKIGARNKAKVKNILTRTSRNSVLFDPLVNNYAGPRKRTTSEGSKKHEQEKQDLFCMRCIANAFYRDHPAWQNATAEGLP